MARERNNKEKHKHKDKHKAVAKAPPAQRKSSKSPKPSKPSKGHKSSSNAAHHSIKEPAGVKKPSKSKQPVNIAGVFKKSRYDDKKYRKQKQRSPTPEPDLADEFRGTLPICIMGSITNGSRRHRRSPHSHRH